MAKASPDAQPTMASTLNLATSFALSKLQLFFPKEMVLLHLKKRNW